MTKIVFTILFFTIFLTNSYSGTKTNNWGDGDSFGREGPDPAPKYRLGYKEMKRAEKLDKKGKINKAKVKYKKALDFFLEANAENPGDPNTLYYLGFASTKLGKYDNAEIYYLLGLEIQPNHISIYKNLGELYLNTNRKEKAIERLKTLKSCNCEEYDQLKELIEKKK